MEGGAKEREDIGVLLHLFGPRLAPAVAAIGIDAKQYRGWSFLRELESGSVLKAVEWDNAVVVIGCHH